MYSGQNRPPLIDAKADMSIRRVKYVFTTHDEGWRD